MPAAQTDTSRRSAFRSLFAAISATAAGVFGLRPTPPPPTPPASSRFPTPHSRPRRTKQAPLFSSAKVHGGLVFIAGEGYHEAGDIKVHAKSVLDQLEAELTKAGSSMDKVLKVNVYLHDLEDYAGMNEVFRGRFGPNPPVRTTIAAYGGIPGKSLVEIDWIAAV